MNMLLSDSFRPRYRISLSFRGLGFSKAVQQISKRSGGIHVLTLHATYVCICYACGQVN